MYTYTRKYGSQRTSARSRVQMQLETEPQLTFGILPDHGTTPRTYVLIVPESVTEWDRLIAEVIAGRRQFALKQKRNAELTGILDKKGY